MKANCQISILKIVGLSFLIAAVPLWNIVPGACAEGFPAAGWHRGDVSAAQENSIKAIRKALTSTSPNIEVDILDFINSSGRRIGLLVHDYEMDRITGSKGKFGDYTDVNSLPYNTANPDMPAEPFLSVIDLFDLIQEYKEEGIISMVSLDMKEEGETGEKFGEWVGNLIRQYGFEKHVFASSFFKSNVIGVKKSCHECLTGGLVFNDHFALQYLDPKYTSLDLTALSKATFLLGFWKKEDFKHDFVLIQDGILLSRPELIDYWKNERKVKFVGMFTYDKRVPYNDEEWKILRRADWLELEPCQMDQWLKQLDN
jgi:glycerophosphoryl diester phosphodiesterase